MTVTLKDYKGDVSTWCPGCGHFSVLASLQKVLLDSGIEPHEAAVVTGIGCSSKLSEYIRTYGFHTLHGRSLPVAQAVKLANRNMKVIAAGGDGDGYGIGAGHFVHAARRNIDILYLVMDNRIYGLTKGQTSPTSAQGTISKTSPSGSEDREIKPLELALSAGASFVAQAFSGDIKTLNELIKAGLNHRGFALINIFSPCVTFNKVNTYDYFKERLTNLKDCEGYDSSNKVQAYAKLMETDGLLQGILYQNERPVYDSLINGYTDTPLPQLDLQLDDSTIADLWSRFQE